MGLRDRIKGLLKRPEPPQASKPAVPTPAPPAGVPTPSMHGAGVPGGEGEPLPWYLQQDTEGWDETNPGDEPGKKNLVE